MTDENLNLSDGMSDISLMMIDGITNFKTLIDGIIWTPVNKVNLITKILNYHFLYTMTVLCRSLDKVLVHV